MIRYNAAQFDALFDHANAAMIKAFVAAANRIKNRARLLELEAAIQSGDAEGVMAILGIDPSQFIALDDEMSRLYKASGELEMRYQQSAINRQIKEVRRARQQAKGGDGQPPAGSPPGGPRGGAGGGAVGPSRPVPATDPFLTPWASLPSAGGTGGGRPGLFAGTGSPGPEPGLGEVKVQFNTRNVRAENYLREESGRLIRDITEDQRNLVRNILEQGMREGRNPRDLATQLVGKLDKVSGKRIGGVILLTDKQGEWVMNARAELETGNYSAFLGRGLRNKRYDAMIKRARDSGKPLSQAKIDEIMADYESRMLQMRAHVIARTEMLRSQNAAKMEAARQAAEAAGTPPEYIKRQWKSAHDKRVRDTHVGLNNKTVQGFSEPFVSSSGAQLLFPGDTSLDAPPEEVIQCRCMVVHNVDYVAMARENGWVE